MPDLEMLQADGTWKKIGTTTKRAVDSLELFQPKHTPGPWEIEEESGSFSLVNRYHQGDDWCIAEVYGIGQGIPIEVARANAALLLAAPALLQDLTEAAAQLRKYETLHRAKGTPDSLEKADVNAALAARFEATIAAAVGGAE